MNASAIELMLCFENALYSNSISLQVHVEFLGFYCVQKLKVQETYQVTASQDVHNGAG